MDDLRARLADVASAGAGAALWGPLQAERTRVLLRLLTKISKPRKHPAPRKKARLPKKMAFRAGDYLVFTKANGKAVPVIVWLVERRAPLRYDFVFPNLGKSEDASLVARLLDTRVPITDEELATFLSKAKRPRVFTLEYAVIKPHLARLRPFGNRAFDFAVWQCGACGHGVTFADFERNVDAGGCRALTADELAFVANRPGG